MLVFAKGYKGSEKLAFVDVTDEGNFREQVVLVMVDEGYDG